ncbi:serine hydrolase domain-containing protein [Sanguibacter suaedae]|uniref:Beta-lactamase family protein n=1 Tax=Sanguibacter suaedae TaxID=2795737 RepID=A0A934IBD7_9MICO|nr:serine hydrolase domain-containing protein [Sanguibacter suaedae]MBI9115580.1 beta-lactamase family protein [Sanguibacter suaedae]
MPHDDDHGTTTTRPTTTPSRRRAVAIGATSVLAVGALGAGVWWGAGSVLADDPGVASSAAGEPAANPVVQDRLEGLVDLGFPAALASVTHPDGDHDDYVAGVGDVATGAAVPVDGEVRVGSNTKTFTAVTVLQLVDEGLVELDAPIETYLPGLVRGDGIDGRAITVRQLLQHTSGLPEYTAEFALELEKIQHAYVPTRDLIDIALAQPAHFAPGERWEYSNTNYILLGMLIEKVTQRPVAEEVTERIVDPLGLEHTYYPTAGEQELRGDHPTAYHVGSDGEQIDVTELDPSWAGAAGQVVASPSDLNEFARAVLDGRLLSEEMMTEMQTTVPSDDGSWPGAEYGLGLQSYPLSCGGVIWGHGGDIHGFQTRNGVAPDGTAFSVAVTSLPWGFIDMDDEDALDEAYDAVTDTLDAAFCEA